MNDHIGTPPPQWSGVRRLPGLKGRIPRPRRGAVVLTTVGSLGDLYPVLAIARALELTGLEPRLALSPEDCDVARRWGLLATPVGPSQAEICARLGVTRDQIAAEVLRDAGPLIRDVAIPMLAKMTTALAPLCDGASCVAGTTFALNAPLAAEMARLPYVPLLLQPMLQFSALDPPRGRGFGAMIPAPRSRPAIAWNRLIIRAARAVLRRRHAADLTKVRMGLGLPPEPGTPLLEHRAAVPLRLGLWHPRFAPLPEDAPDGLITTGFPPPPDGTLDPEVERWIEAGPAPLVVTLGSIAQDLGGAEFWSEAADLAHAMGLRAVLLHGQATAPTGPDILPLPYAPHAPLFPQAAAILHHGGIGTSAEALRAGRPQLVVPVGGDQPDNAARLTALGVAAALPLRRFTPARAKDALEPLLDRFDYPAAAELGAEIAALDGAGEAALHLARVALKHRPHVVGMD
ncbi:MAG: glycosyltransferase [Pseudomonadota bacterium]